MSRRRKKPNMGGRSAKLGAHLNAQSPGHSRGATKRRMMAAAKMAAIEAEAKRAGKTVAQLIVESWSKDSPGG